MAEPGPIGRDPIPLLLLPDQRQEETFVRNHKLFLL